MKEPSTQTPVEVSRSELPLHCPVPSSSLWDSHPRVFIPLEESGSAKCPYCGTQFVLTDKPAATANKNDDSSDAKTGTS